MYFSYTSVSLVTNILIFSTKHESCTGKVSAHDLFCTQAPYFLYSIHNVNTKD